jgi:glucose-6-phosphate isomerase
VTFVASGKLASLCDWIEQLIAESTGKSGRGILPVVGEPLGDPHVYGGDRVFLELFTAGDTRSAASGLDELARAGQPVLQFGLTNVYDIAGQMFVWEMAIATASHVIGVHPFNQPDVEAVKALARKAIARYEAEGTLPSEPPAAVSGDVDIFDSTEGDPAGALEALLASGNPGDYVAIQAFLAPTPETGRALEALRLRIRDATHLATTLGYGPRFLHSTGQLHKGDGGHGLFLQVSADPLADIGIPDEPGSQSSEISFGVLTAAEANGDRKVLLDRGRRVLGLHLRGDVQATIDGLTSAPINKAVTRLEVK